MASVFTAQCFRFGGLRCSPLNAALVANEENVAKAECLGLMFVCFWAWFRISIFSFVFVKIALVSCVVWIFCFRNRFTC
ncbi:hypothetical protein EN01_003635 [Vibrio parahaemolyticus]|nr:hypothetical protein EN01_003635 [Vibrio parahaemolyticus]